jgi:hypothetical protein
VPSIRTEASGKFSFVKALERAYHPGEA